MEVRAILVGAVIGAVAGWFMSSAKGGSTIAAMLKNRGVVR
jgi:uncharacterized membrane protein YeaQ/YmgE (transglycosylase-associated protein family)